MTDERRTDRTTAQMLEAPKGAYYVWYCAALSYPKQLAKHLGRADLKIVSPSFFGHKGRGSGLKTKIIIDHGCVLSISNLTTIARCNTLVDHVLS